MEKLRPPAVTAGKKGRPAAQPLDPTTCQGISMKPANASEWFTLGERLLALETAGHSQAAIARALGTGTATISRLQKAARWPGTIRARILSCAELFPPPLLMRLARRTFKDEGSTVAGANRRLCRSRVTLAAAVELTIQKRKLPEPSAAAPAREIEDRALEERTRRQELQKKLEALAEENRQLRAAVSMDQLSALLRENRALRVELHRLQAASGSVPRKERTADQLYRDGILGTTLRCAVETVDWKRGLLLLNFRSGDLLDGFFDAMVTAGHKP